VRTVNEKMIRMLWPLIAGAGCMTVILTAIDAFNGLKQATPHVGDMDVDAGPGLLLRQSHHLGRDVARGDVETAMQEGHEALAGAAPDVEQAVAAQAVLARKTFDG